MMTNDSMLRFLSAWATHLNRTQYAGALVSLQPNGNLVLSIKNKLFQPFICICTAENNAMLKLRLSYRYDFRKSAKHILYGNGTLDEYGCYIFSEVTISGALVANELFLTEIIASGANRFFSASLHHWEKIKPLELPLVA